MKRPSSRRPSREVILGLAMLGLLVAGCGGDGGGADTSGAPMFAIERFQLTNGLEVILHPDHTLPLAYVSVWYHVGSGDGTPGKSGLAHLCEHMMFEGSAHVKPGELFQRLGVAGNPDGNATTNADRTNYFETVPSNQLETVLWLESDRMGFLALDEGRFENQRDVVRNERRQNYENVAFGAETIAIGEALYPEGHPYRHLTIGLHEDIQNETLADASSLFHTWYGPGNATLLIAGDFDSEAVKTMVSKWFATIPGQPKPTHTPPAVPFATLPVRQIVTDPFTQLRRIHYVWPSATWGSEDEAGMQFLASILGLTPTGRLYRALVVDLPWAENVAVWQDGRTFSGEFHVAVDVRPGVDLDGVQAELNAVLDDLRTNGVEPYEVTQVLAQTEVTFATALETLSARGETMQAYNHLYGYPDGFGRDLATYRKADRQRLHALAERYLRPERVEITTMPGTP